MVVVHDRECRDTRPQAAHANHCCSRNLGNVRRSKDAALLGAVAIRQNGVCVDTVYLLVLNEHRRVEGRVARRELASAPWVVQDGAIRLQPEAPERRIVHFLALVVIRGKPELPCCDLHRVGKWETEK